MEEDKVTQKLRGVFAPTAVYKAPERNQRFSALSIPSYLRDWLVMRFSDDRGEVNMEDVMRFVRSTIPGKDDWEPLKARMVDDGEAIRFLAKTSVVVDVSSGEMQFSLPDLGFPRKRGEAVVARDVARDKREELFASAETWGVVELEWRLDQKRSGRETGVVYMVGFQPFQPYVVDTDFYEQARQEFTFEEWVDVLLMGIDYNPSGFVSLSEKLMLLTRLLPFVEKRLNLMELAPKGTGKSYMYSQLSKHGWLVSGGSISRARLFYNIASKRDGLVKRHDYVAMDEVQTITFTDDDEVKGALKGYMESGEYRVGDHDDTGDAGIILLGNISQERMDVNDNMIRELPVAFHESALIDRFHGFVRGWAIPRMNEDLKAKGWALNTEYLTEMFHALRGDIRYRAVVDHMLNVPRGADTRDTEAIKRIATAYLKLLFPDAVSPDILDHELFAAYCLAPALEMRGIIRKQLNKMDVEYGTRMPDIELSELSTPPGTLVD